jgi:hypothetical protein
MLYTKSRNGFTVKHCGFWCEALRLLGESIAAFGDKVYDLY